MANVKVTVRGEHPRSYELLGAPYRSRDYTVHVLTIGGVEEIEPKTGNWLSKVKCVGTVADWVKLDIFDIQGELLVSGLVLDEADELTGPFGKVKLSNQQSINGIGQTTTEPLRAIVWEYEHE